MVKGAPIKNNASIRSFFKPIPSSPAVAPPAPPQPSVLQAPQPASAYSSPTPANNMPASSSPPELSQIVVQTEAPRPAVSRDAVIQGSDEDDSDGSLPDIFSSSRRPANPAPALAPKREIDVCITPKAKRTARDFHASPLILQSKHKFDMQALLRQDEKNDAMEKSAREFSAYMEKVDAKMEDKDDETDEDAAAALKDHIKASTKGADEDEAANKARILKALDRTQVKSTRKRYYFFNQEEAPTSALGRRPFPKEAAKGPWKILEDAKHRQIHFQSGMPYGIQEHMGGLPDEIFLWILEEVSFETNYDLRTEYVKLLSICHMQISRLVTPDRLRQLFANLGATKDIDNLEAAVGFRDEDSNPYTDRDWSRVRSILNLVASTSSYLNPNVLGTGMQILLRFGMDGIALENFGLTQDWRQAAESVARAVPNPAWSTFCDGVCKSLYQSTNKDTLRWQALAQMGGNEAGSPIFELKRRLAAVLFFDDLHRAEQKPEETISIHAIIDRLNDDDLSFDAKSDFQELYARMMLLNVALDDGSRGLVKTSKASTNFDDEVDELADMIKHMLARIAPQQRGIHTSRIEAKDALSLIHEKLLWSTRTRARPKKSIMGLDDESEEDADLPKQQDFMKSFLKRKTPKIEAQAPEIEA